MIKKVFEREDGYTEYTYTHAANNYVYRIEEWDNTFIVGDWFRDNTFDSLEAAITAIHG